MIRNQIADCIKYIRRTDIHQPVRDFVSDGIGSVYNGITLADLIESYSKYNLNKILLEAHAHTDYDGYPEGRLEIYHIRKQTDEEYFDYVTSLICPTSYQIEEFQQYQRLKFKYGD